MSDEGHPLGPILSDFAEDVEMQELIQLFVSEMPGRIEEMERAYDDADFELVRRIAHQLKGACAGYGFPMIGEAAAALESTMESTDEDVRRISNDFKQLVELCSRATA